MLYHSLKSRLARLASVSALGILVLAPPVTLNAQEEDQEEYDHFFQGWSGRLDLGYTYQSGRTNRNELTLRGQADREAGRNKYRAIAEYVYGEQKVDTDDGTTTIKSSDRYGANFRWRRTLSEYFFTQSLTSYEVDQVRGVKQRAEQNLSLGYQYLYTDTFEASVGPGFTAQYNRELGVEAGMNYMATAFQDFIWNITDAYKFEEDSTFLVNVEDSDDYIYRFNAGLVGTVTESINMSIRYNFLYENQAPPGVDRSEHRLVTSIGYSF